VLRLEHGCGPPDGVAATEIIVLHKRDASRALVHIFFDGEEDDSCADAVLGEMPTADTSGVRVSVSKCAVVGRATCGTHRRAERRPRPVIIHCHRGAGVMRRGLCAPG
jgi:hypothetical protein